MHAFFALHFDPNSYKDVFLWHFDTGCRKNFVIVSVCFWISMKSQLAIFAKHFEIKNLFANFILPSLFNQSTWYVNFLLLCSDLFGVKIIYRHRLELIIQHGHRFAGLFMGHNFLSHPIPFHSSSWLSHPIPSHGISIKMKFNKSY